MKATIPVAETFAIQTPELSLQLISFLEIGLFSLLSALIYYVGRRILMIISNTGALEKRTLFFQFLNISTFVFPALVFLYGLTHISQESLFASLLFFIIFSIIFGFSMIVPARNLLASLILTLRGDLKVGDYISVDKIEGEIYSIGALNVLLVNKSGVRSFVPTHRLLQYPYELQIKKGGPSIIINVAADKINKRNLERLAYLCPFKRQGSDVRISTLEGTHKLSLEIVDKEARSWVMRYFEKHT